MSQAPKRLLLLGASGLVGAHVLEQALDDPAFARIHAPTRRALAPHPRLDAPLLDFADLDRWPREVFAVDAVICCLGTTIAAAGSRQRFVAVDHHLPVAIGARAREAGARVFALVSAMSAHPRSRVFYSRVKGETERDAIALRFPSTVIVRPGILDGARNESRPLERAALAALRALAPVLPRAARPSPAGAVARALIEATRRAPPGVTVIPARDLV